MQVCVEVENKLEKMNHSKFIAYNLDFIIRQILHTPVHSKIELGRWYKQLVHYKASWFNIVEQETIESLARDVFREIEAFIFICESNEKARSALLIYEELEELDINRWIIEYDALFNEMFSHLLNYIDDYSTDELNNRMMIQVRNYKPLDEGKEPELLRTYNCVLSEMNYSIKFFELYIENLS